MVMLCLINTLTIGKHSLEILVTGAQIMIDQYLSAAEDKWKLQMDWF